MLRIFLLHSFFFFPSLNFFRKHYQNGLKFQTEAPLNLWPWPILNKQRSKQLCNSENNTNLPPKCVQKQVGRSGELHVNTLPRQVGAAFSRLPQFLTPSYLKLSPKTLKLGPWSPLKLRLTPHPAYAFRTLCAAKHVHSTLLSLTCRLNKGSAE